MFRCRQRLDCRFAYANLPPKFFGTMKSYTCSPAPRGFTTMVSRLMFRPALLLLGTALLGTSCGTLSSCVISDPAPAVAPAANRRQHPSRGGPARATPYCQWRNLRLAVGVLTPDGSVQNFNYGPSGRPGEAQAVTVTGDDIFQIGSVSKLFVAALLAILVDEGQLHYPDTVGSILPPEIPLVGGMGELTLQELMTHTGGLPREAIPFTQFRYVVDYVFTGHNLYGYIDKAYLYEYLRTCEVKPRGQREYAYTNIGVALVAHLIEVKTGRSFPDLVEEKICRPLKMRDTAYFLDASQQKRLVAGHVGGSAEIPLAQYAHGGLGHGRHHAQYRRPVFHGP